VQLIYDPQEDVIRSVMHFAHGLEFRFDITSEAFANTRTVAAPDGPMQEIRYCNYKNGSDLNLASLDLSTLPPRVEVNVDQLRRAQNNVVRLFQDPNSLKFEHPVVYIEKGSHEFYPTEAWRFYAAPKHNGKGFHFLTSAPPNLGEVDHALPDTDEAAVIMLYNGLWGTFSRLNSPPPGPTLHLNWTPVKGSSSEALLNSLSLGY